MVRIEETIVATQLEMDRKENRMERRVDQVMAKAVVLHI